ncbi:MAG: tRNA-dihydrouridine synthase family protein [Lachnospiraceae bacterium]|nr:tRNA-dihydrouridine synthase family protein [Lachnospiraceae bacterium]
MDFYLAPMEGVTGYIYRNAIHDLFGEGIVKYFTPFIVPRPKKGMQNKERRDLQPENNTGIRLVPQILTNQAADFLALSKEIHEKYGWEEIDLNAGCPSKTVISNGKGAGILKDVAALDHFLEEIFSKTELKLSVKTRLGMEDPEEFAPILEVYNKYPMTELIIHPRVQADQYKGPVRMDAFLNALQECKMPVVYNGDIFSAEDYQKKMACIASAVPDGNTHAGAEEEVSAAMDAAGYEAKLRAVMLGRGLMRDPALARELHHYELQRHTGQTVRDTAAATREELRAFHDRIFDAYQELFDGEMPLLFHMKELWGSMSTLFPEKEKSLKKIRKSRNAVEYLAGVREIL